MPAFSIGEAWSQLAAYVGEHWKILAIIAAITSLLSAVIQTVMIGGSPEAFAQSLVTQMSSGNPAAAAGAGGLIGVAALAGAFIGIAGQFVALRVTLAREDAGSALSYAAVAGLLMLLFSLAVGLAVGIVFEVIFGGLGIASGGSPTTVGAVAILLGLVLVPVLLWIAARLSVVSVAMSEQRSTNPLFGLGASWRLTAPYQWQILGFLVIVFIAAIVVAIIYSMIVAVVTAPFGATLGSILSAVLVGVPQSIFSIAIGVGIYRALLPGGAHNVFD